MEQHQHNPETYDQGQLFGTDVEYTGTTDPDTRRMAHIHFEAHDGGIFPEASPETPAVDISHPVLNDEFIAEEIKTRNRRRAQLGSHSPLERDGTYRAVQAGDVLPGFGIVTHRNLSEALSYANGLEAKRLARGQR